MSLRLALHWTAVTTIAAVALFAANIPFTGTAAAVLGTFAAAGICLIGIATAPTIRKGPNS